VSLRRASGVIVGARSRWCRRVAFGDDVRVHAMRGEANPRRGACGHVCACARADRVFRGLTCERDDAR
jgi:hypothetical protein